VSVDEEERGRLAMMEMSGGAGSATEGESEDVRIERKG
jgi:hypothetical protein